MLGLLKRLFENKKERAVRLKREAHVAHLRRILELKQRIADHKRELRQKLEEKLRAERQRKVEKIRAEKARKLLAERIKKAKALAKARGLRRTRRGGQTVYVNRDGDIVNYLFLYYLLFHTNNETYGRGADYQTPVVSNVINTDTSSDWSGSFSGGSSGGGGASSSWDSGSSSSFDFGGSFGGGDTGGGGASGSW